MNLLFFLQLSSTYKVEAFNALKVTLTVTRDVGTVLGVMIRIFVFIYQQYLQCNSVHILK